MISSYQALCSDFYVNQKVSVKLDLPRTRETMLDLFERVRREYPQMNAFRRYKDELALEAGADETPHRWVAVRSGNIRSGVVNAETFDDAYGLHRCVLEVAPYFLSISPLDIEYLEVLYGFDLAASGNQDAIVANALLGGSPLAGLLEIAGGVPLDFQPLLGMQLGGHLDPAVLGLNEPTSSGITEVHFEVKTRTGPGKDIETLGEPISVYVTLRRYEPVSDLKRLEAAFNDLASIGESLLETAAVPGLVAPISREIAAGDL